MATIGERIKLERERRGWIQAKLADMLNIKIGTLSGYERDYRQPDLAMLEKIAAAFGVSTDYLLGRTDNPQPASKDPLPPDIRKIARAGERMTPEQREKWLRVAEIIFEEELKKK